MTANIDRAQVRQVLEKLQGSWLFSFWGKDATKHIDVVAAGLEDFIAVYECKFQERPDPFKLLETNPVKAAAFLQIDTLLMSTEMKIMVWRVLMGCEITHVDFHYKIGKPPSLFVNLRTPDGHEETYSGRQSDDFRVLRHFGAVGVNGDLILQGYYAPRKV